LTKVENYAELIKENLKEMDNADAEKFIYLYQ
jgi:hypothetical protein